MPSPSGSGRSLTSRSSWLAGAREVGLLRAAGATREWIAQFLAALGTRVEHEAPTHEALTHEPLAAVYPMIDVVGLSFHKWNGLDPARQFVGTANYVDIFTKDPVFWVAFRNTVIWTTLSVIFPPIIGLFLACGKPARRQKTRAVDDQITVMVGEAP